MADVLKSVTVVAFTYFLGRGIEGVVRLPVSEMWSVHRGNTHHPARPVLLQGRRVGSAARPGTRE